MFERSQVALKSHIHWEFLRQKPENNDLFRKINVKRSPIDKIRSQAIWGADKINAHMQADKEDEA